MSNGTQEPHVAMDRLTVTALRVKAERDELLAVLREIVRLWDSPKEKDALSWQVLEAAKSALTKIANAEGE